MYSILHDFKIKAPIHKVFEFITQPEHINNWWTLRCQGTPILNSVYSFYFSKEYDWEAKITFLKTNTGVQYSMTKCSPDWEQTVFGFRLVQNNEDTEIQFYHSQWRHQNHEYRKTNFCWAILLMGLKNYVEHNVVIPFSERS